MMCRPVGKNKHPLGRLYLSNQTSEYPVGDFKKLLGNIFAE